MSENKQKGNNVSQNHKNVSMKVIDCPIAKEKWHGEYIVTANLMTLGDGSVLVLCPMQAACWAHDDKKCPYERQAK